MVLGSQAERGIRSGYGIGHTDVKVVSGNSGGGLSGPDHRLNGGLRSG